MQELDSPERAAQWLRGRVAGTLHCDSRRVDKGDGFIAWPGAATDGRRHVPNALAQGAAACLVERDGVEAFGFDDLPQHETIAAYTHLKAATGPIAAAYFDEPSLKLPVIAVTGTNGKTSTAWWLSQALSALPAPATLKCAVIGTLGTGLAPHVSYTGLTTPDPVLLQQQLRRFIDEGIAACAIEASSIGLVERRLDGTHIRVAIFTNFTQDHLDYHGTMEAYWEAKSALFRWRGLQAAVVNIDDAKGAELLDVLSGAGVDVWTVSSVVPARLVARDIGYSAQGLRMTLVEGEARVELQSALIGQFNAQNLLGVIGAMRALSVPLADAVRACATLGAVPGRMEFIAEPGQPIVVVDYAHTPDALEKALSALAGLAAQRGGRLVCLFGCGGDRDATKRPLMAAIAEKNADLVVVTSDNPRTERPEHIISQILLGFADPQRVKVQADRAQAIDETLALAGPNDVVLLAGKGHEDHQEANGVRQPFSDRGHALSALARKVAA